MLTNSDEIIRYFPLKPVILNWRKGSEILYKGEIDGTTFTDYGVIDILSRPNRFKYTYWNDNHGTENMLENRLSIDYELSPKDNGTSVIMAQSNLKNEDMYNMMNNSVWDYLLKSMKTHIGINNSKWSLN